jgi:hypothetical protein
MRKFEFFVELLLTIFLLIVSTQVVLIATMKEGVIIFFPWSVPAWAFVGMLVAFLCGNIFPLGDVGKYLNTFDIEKIYNFKVKYKYSFGVLALAFLGVIILCAKTLPFQIMGGLILLICYGAIIFRE